MSTPWTALRSKWMPRGWPKSFIVTEPRTQPPHLETKYCALFNTPWTSHKKKGDSSWLTSLPLKEFGFTLHKGAYRDAIALHYGWQPSYCPSSCACGSNVSVERTLSCPKGSFPTICHNEVRDFTANLMTVVCHDFCVEPSLQPIGEVFSNATAILMTVPDSTLQQMDFGVVILREPSSMCEFSTPMLLQTDNNSPPAIKKEKEKSLNKEFVKLSIVPSFLWSCH